jgi:hypothetical protein
MVPDSKQNREDTNKLTLLAFKIIAILHNTLLATFIYLLETVSKGIFRNRSQNSCRFLKRPLLTVSRNFINVANRLMITPTKRSLQSKNNEVRYKKNIESPIPEQWSTRYEQKPKHRRKKILPRHESFSVTFVVCCQVEVSATSWSLVQRSPTDCGASLCVIKKAPRRGGHSPLWDPQPGKIISNYTFLTLYIGHWCANIIYYFVRGLSGVDHLSLKREGRYKFMDILWFYSIFVHCWCM